jgi:hypothetical protein
LKWDEKICHFCIPIFGPVLLKMKKFYHGLDGNPVTVLKPGRFIPRSPAALAARGFVYKVSSEATDQTCLSPGRGAARLVECSDANPSANNLATRAASDCTDAISL